MQVKTVTADELDEVLSDLSASTDSAAETAGRWFELMWCELAGTMQWEWIYVERDGPTLRVWQMVGEPLPPSLEEESRGERFRVNAARVARLNWALHHKTGQWCRIPDLEVAMARRTERRDQVLAALLAAPVRLLRWDKVPA
jgi:hypothetical protein